MIKSHDIDPLPLAIPSFFNPALNPDTLAVQPLGFQERPIELDIPTKPNSGVLSDHLQIYQVAIVACIYSSPVHYLLPSCLYIIVGASSTNALILHLRIRCPCGSQALYLPDHAKGGT